VALAWVLRKGTIPIIGPRTPEQLADNLKAASLALSPAQIEQLDEASSIPLGAPHEALASPDIQARFAGGHPELLDNCPVAII
jgi:diketogulonate reductase-like aldo/keto reductase